MGGNAFELAERMSDTEYDTVCKDIRFVLVSNGLREDFDFTIPNSVREKTSHGDVDVLVTSNFIEMAYWALVTYLNCPGEIKNPSGYNLLLVLGDKHIQVDLNKVSPLDFDFAADYFSWNDLGNLIGRIAHRQGLKFGHDGLWYIHRDGDQQLGEILLPCDYIEAITYLGFNAVEYQDGFDTYEQMFNWVKNSAHFDPCAYPLEHRNHAARMRDRKRKTYMAFLQWVGFDGEYVESDKAWWLEQHKKNFYVLGERIAELDKENALAKEYKAKVNGAIVRDLVGVDGKELGELMHVVRRVLPRDVALKYCAATIESGIMFAYQIYKDER
jgi:hypothetical protein